MARHYPHSKTIYVPTPTWGNHIPLFKDSGLEVKFYRYFDKKTVGLDFEGLKEDLQVCQLDSYNVVYTLIWFLECPRRCHCFAACLRT